jgi:hypothetical protein
VVALPAAVVAVAAAVPLLEAAVVALAAVVPAAAVPAAVDAELFLSLPHAVATITPHAKTASSDLYFVMYSPSG